MSLARAILTGDVAQLPSRRDEDWRWSDLRGLLRDIPPPAADLEPTPNPALATLERAGVTVARFVAGSGSQTAELPMVFGAGTKTVLVEHYESLGEGAVASVNLDYELEEGAQVERIVIADDAADAISIVQADVRLSPGARFSQTILVAGARRQRFETWVKHPGQGAVVRLDGVYLVGDRRHADITTVVDHQGADGATAQLTKGAVAGSGRGVFQGRIVVERGADQTDARMGHHALILSDRGEVDAKPELLIYADDVACAHGNTVGALDEDALFYARQRGIPEVQARAMLTEAFIGEVVDRIEHDGARDLARAWVTDKLRGLAWNVRYAAPRFDVQAARAEFPILGREIHGKPLIYLDNGASAQKPRAVIEAMSAMMSDSYANVHRGLHTLANETTDAYERARETVRRFINAGSVGEIVFTKGATEAINLVASSFGRSLKAGDEIVLSQMEHHANVVPWHFLRERQGVVLRFAPVRDDGSLDMDAYRALLGPKTRMVAMAHMSNVLGTINPVAEIVAAAHAAGAQVLLDGAQAIVHAPVDVQALGVDYYVFSGHKLYGPTGIGVLYGKAERLAALPPYQGGGEMIGTVTEEAITYAEPPHRFEAGTPAIIEAVGLGAAIEWLESLDRAAVAAHEAALLTRVEERLDGANWLTPIGRAPGKGAIFAFNVEGAHAHDIAQVLDRYGVAVRAGTHCAEPLMRRFGVTSSVRASFALYNTLEEADIFVDALTKTRTFFS